MRISTVFILMLFFVLRVSGQNSKAVFKPFVHPGMAQSKPDLDYVKAKVLAGEQPWKDAFERLKTQTSPDFKPVAFAHISVGAYGANSIGGTELFKSAEMAYNNAYLWYITNDKAYARKAIEILNAWSYVLWDFDDNNAKLNVGLTAYYFLNAAELLRYTPSDWKPKDMEQFKRMMLTVYYPTIKDFFTEANGNWDASIINTMLCIAVFTDDHAIFDRALERYNYGPNNSGITKYIYPGGQIQETTRDWGHVQLGIGEFEKAAQVAWTQGTDLYGTADNRLALGYEYTARFMLGEEVPVYGIISQRERGKYRDIYEAIYQHYQTIGIPMPYTERVIKEHTRSTSSIALLASTRKPVAGVAKSTGTIKASDQILLTAGALKQPGVKPPADAIIVSPGDSIQAAINACMGKSNWVVLASGIHKLRSPLLIPSGVTLSGQGRGTILTLAPSTTGITIANMDNTMHDVTIRDLLIEGATNTDTGPDPNSGRRTRSYMSASPRAGIQFSADKDGQMHNIRIENVTVQNCTKSGVSIRGASKVEILNCDISDNGATVVPGAGLMHNLHLTHSDHILVQKSRFDTSPAGSGIDISFCNTAEVKECEAARNKLSGIRCTESDQVKVVNNLAEGNDGSGIKFDSLMDNFDHIEVRYNICRYNGEKGIYTERLTLGIVADNKVNNNKQK